MVQFFSDNVTNVICIVNFRWLQLWIRVHMCFYPHFLDVVASLVIIPKNHLAPIHETFCNKLSKLYKTSKNLPQN